MYLVDPNHVASGERAARIDGSAKTPSSRTTLRSLGADFTKAFLLLEDVEELGKNSAGDGLHLAGGSAASSLSCVVSKLLPSLCRRIAGNAACVRGGSARCRSAGVSTASGADWMRLDQVPPLPFEGSR